jgi:hypothetical protein
MSPRPLALALVLAACRGETVAPPDAFDVGPSCEGDCQITTLTAAFEETRLLDHAVFGINAGDSTLHVEVYAGGDPGCPTETSATPDYALVLGKVAMPTGPAPTSSSGNVLDFVGDLLGGELGAQAKFVIINARAASLPDFVALGAYLEFDTGAVSGHLYATHCSSLDSR